MSNILLPLTSHTTMNQFKNIAAIFIANKSASEATSPLHNICYYRCHQNDNRTSHNTKTNKTVQAKKPQEGGKKQKTYLISKKDCNNQEKNTKNSRILHPSEIPRSAAIKRIQHQPNRSISKELHPVIKLYSRCKESESSNELKIALT